MSPADYMAELIRDRLSGNGYSVFSNHMPDSPDKAIVVNDLSSGRLEPRGMVTKVRNEHPAVQVLVRGVDHTAHSVAQDIADLADETYHYRCEDGKNLQVITKTNTIGSLGVHPQTRRTMYTQQFRLTLE